MSLPRLGIPISRTQQPTNPSSTSKSGKTQTIARKPRHVSSIKAKQKANPTTTHKPTVKTPRDRLHHSSRRTKVHRSQRSTLKKTPKAANDPKKKTIRSQKQTIKVQPPQEPVIETQPIEPVPFSISLMKAKIPGLQKCQTQNELVRAIVDLERVDLPYSSVNALDNMEMCMSVRHLNLQGNLLTTFPALELLAHSLESINISDNKLEEMPDMSQYIRLRSLNLSGNPLSSIPVKCLPPSLTNLIVGQITLDYGEAMKRCPNLGNIDMTSERPVVLTSPAVGSRAKGALRSPRRPTQSSLPGFSIDTRTPDLRAIDILSSGSDGLRKSIDFQAEQIIARSKKRQQKQWESIATSVFN